MANRFEIQVPDVNALLAQLPSGGYDQFLVLRSTQGPSGPFQELTASAAQAATIQGAIASPYAGLIGLDLRLRVNGVERGIVFSTQTTAAAVAAEIQSVLVGVATAADQGGYVRITTTSTGTAARLEIVGGTAAAALGFASGQFSTGRDARIALVADVTSYTYVDYSGGSGDYYVVQYRNTSTNTTSGYTALRGPATTSTPKQRADTRAPRGLTVLRRSTYVFKHSFWRDVAAGIALAPLDASRYPAYQIVDPAGQIVQAGVASVDGTAPNYRVEFFCPPDAMLSNDDRRWRIEWTMVSDDRRQIQPVAEFDVRDVDVTVSQVRELKLLAMPYERMRLFIRLHSRPYDLRLNVIPDGSPSMPLVPSATFPETPGTPSITEVIDNDTYVYYFDIPAGEDKLRPSVIYSAVWTCQESIASAPDFISQTITVPDRSVLKHMASLRMIIDKRQKRLNTIQAYQDSDLYEYLRQGLSWLNSWYPTTSHPESSVPQALEVYWLLLSAVYALNAQGILGGDISVNFSGLSTTIDYDLSGQSDSAAQRMIGFLNDRIAAAKTMLWRKRNAIAVTSVRPIRYTAGGRSMVVRVGSTVGNAGGNELLAMLTSFGLF